MKVWIKTHDLLKIFKDHITVTTKTIIPKHWHWLKIDDKIVTFDFLLFDKLMLDLEPVNDETEKTETMA